MQHKMFKNRRGEDMIVDFWAIVVFAVICILFLIVFSFNKSAAEKDVNTEFSNKDANFILQAFLRAPAIGIDDSRTVADIIAEDVAKNDFDATDRLFGEFFKGMQDYNVYLSVDGTNDENFKRKMGYTFVERVSITTPATGTVVGGILTAIWNPNFDSYSAVTYVPGYEERIYIKLEVDVKTDTDNEALTKES